MSSIEPRLNPSQGGSRAPGAAPGANGSNGGGGSATGGRDDGAGADGNRAATVAVAAGVESALAAVQQQLARQASTITMAPPAPAAAPAPPTARSTVPTAPTAPITHAAPVRPAPPTVVPAAAPLVVPAAPTVAPPGPPVEAEEAVAVAAASRVARARRAELPDDDEDYEDSLLDTRPRRPRPVLDPDELTKDERRALGKLKARKVRRIIRHVSPWSVFKVSILFYLSMWLILMVAGVILWKVGQEAGVLTNVEKFYAKASGEKVFEIDGRRVFRAASAAGVILVFAGTGFTVLLAVLFNLITDLTGGVRVSVLELESTRRVLRRGARADRLRAKADASTDESDVDADRDGDGAAGDLDDAMEDGDRPPLVAASSQPTVEFAADAIVDGRGELESSAPGLPARSRTAAGDGDAAFAPER